MVGELQRSLLLLVQERRFVVAHEIGLSAHYICCLVVESGCHGLVLVTVPALNNIATAVPLIICCGMIRSAATVIRLVQLISQDFQYHLLLIDFIFLHHSEIIH